MSQYDEFQENIINNRNKREDNMNSNGSLSFDDDIDFGKPSSNTQKAEHKDKVLHQKAEIITEDDFPKNQTDNQGIIDKVVAEDDFPISKETRILSPIEKISEEKKEVIKKEENFKPVEKASFSAEDFEKFKKDVSENINDVKKEIKIEVQSLVEEFSKTLLELKDSIKIISNVSKPISELNVLIETQFEKMKGNNKELEENLFKKLNNISQSIDQEVEKNEKFIKEHEVFLKSTNYNDLRNEIIKNEDLSNDFIEKNNNKSNDEDDFEDMGIKNKNKKTNANEKKENKPLGLFGKIFAKIGF